MSMLDDETLQMYVEESRDHLESIESDLLSIEQMGEDIDEELVNKVFRAAHSIKGGAGFLGLNTIKELAHKIENVLDLIRNRELVPNPEIINILLLAFDRLSELIDNIEESNEMDISEHVTALMNIASGGLPEKEQESVINEVDIKDKSGRTIFTIKEFDLNQATKGGKYVYLIEFDLIHDIHQKDKQPYDVVKDIQSTGEIIDIKLDLDAVGTLEDGKFSNKIPLYVLYSTIIEPDIINTLFDLPAEQIHVVKGQETSQAESEVQAEEETVTTSEEEVKEEVEQKVKAEPKVEEKVEEAKKEVKKSKPVSKVTPVKKTEKSQPKPKSQPKAASHVAAVHAETLRVHVSLLENLMNLAGELVLSRNQLMQAITQGNEHDIQTASQRIDLVTSELQEAIMLTRMQPVGNIFNKFPRVVRDLARELGKEIELVLEGKDVELDKTIIEGLSDPLTHLVRNSADHGIEPPDERVAKGKNPVGKIILKAYHAAGQVNIEIRDDGKGMDPDVIAKKAVEKGLVTEEQVRSMNDKEKLNLIFLPGLSTAEKVSDVSGRGVGMDVVKSNLDKLGGQIDIETELGKGTTIRIKLPLTLAIIPSLLVSVEGERFAIPQVNVNELIEVPASQVKERIEKVGDADVLILRGELIPLLSLAEVLGLKEFDAEESDFVQKYQATGGAVKVVIAQAGSFKYGLVVDELHDSVEIVVKPLGRHLKDCLGYAGATIMGDGKVALILDVVGLAKLAELSAVNIEEKDRRDEKREQEGEEMHTLFLFNNAPGEACAVPLDLVARVELIKAEEIEVIGGKKVIKYRGGSLPIFALEEVANIGHLELEGDLVVIVFVMSGHEVGLLATPPVDAVEAKVKIDDFSLKQPGIAGSTILNDKTTLVVDIFEFFETLNPDWFKERKEAVQEIRKETGEKKVLLVEDSDFFRSQVKKFIEDEGYKVVPAEDGQVAWDYLNEHPDEISVVVTDIEMPNMDGFELTKLIKESPNFSHLPVIALTSLAGEEDIEKGKEVGIDDYQIKLDKEKLLQSIFSFLAKKAA
ncbi:two-component system, chemotaxis family, sensor kinase CheA [Desulfonauticus submarinus]|uniref:histidine kinase n=1 Tax=Desulfonauticus submarinus TaxID=206665 RepID=A0A1H0ED72_9BACT|nr:chemotaxis protein CheW [Desulfonauticus submarinus]SDN80291.1 two-component system, chemotaxis family, sensor kinase CheA [Desulfonauticus submarinus]